MVNDQSILRTCRALVKGPVGGGRRWRVLGRSAGRSRKLAPRLARGLAPPLTANFAKRQSDPRRQRQAPCRFAEARAGCVTPGGPFPRRRRAESPLETISMGQHSRRLPRAFQARVEPAQLESQLAAPVVDKAALATSPETRVHRSPDAFSPGSTRFRGDDDGSLLLPRHCHERPSSNGRSTHRPLGRNAANDACPSPPARAFPVLRPAWCRPAAAAARFVICSPWLPPVNHLD